MQNWSPRGTVSHFIATAVVAIAAIAIGVFFLARDVLTDEAIRVAQNVTILTGANAISPVLSDALLIQDPVAISAVDKVVRSQVLDEDLVRVKIWSTDGTILYADQTELIGQKFELAHDLEETLREGPRAEVSELDGEENLTEQHFDKLLEVYDRLATPNGTPVLFEAYLSYDRVEDNASSLIAAITPALFGGLLLLLAVQIPLALGLSRRLEFQSSERERLLRRNIEMSETERRRIASDLHDGVVQRLVGNSYSLSAAAADSRKIGAEQTASLLDDVSTELRQAVRELRTMIVTVAPPRLRTEGLAAAIDDLTSPLLTHGVKVSVDVGAVRESVDDEALLYRVTQEAVRNIVKHAGATEIGISIEQRNNGGVRCVVVDNGRGFEPQKLEDQRKEGHVGLQLLEESIADAGGTLRINSSAGNGTTLTVELPAR